MRELKEETGCELPTDLATELCVFESCYPPHIAQGHPRRQHLVVYMLVRHPLVAANICLQLQPEEVDCAAFFSLDYIRSFVRSPQSPAAPPACPTVPGIHVDSSGRHTHMPVVVAPLETECSLFDAIGQRPLERLSTGTKFLLREFLASIEEQGDMATEANG